MLFLSYMLGGVLDYNDLDIWISAHLRSSKSAGRRGILPLALITGAVATLFCAYNYVGDVLPNPWSDWLLSSPIGHRCSAGLAAKAIPVAGILCKGDTIVLHNKTGYDQ